MGVLGAEAVRSVAPRRAGHAPAAPAPVAPARPRLRLVDGVGWQPRRVLTRLVTAAIATLAAVTLFLVVFLHVLLTQGQADLERLQGRADAEAAANRRLRVQVAELESPGRIVTTARQRLGMVPPTTVVYLPAADPTNPLPPLAGDAPPTTAAPTPPSSPAPRGSAATTRSSVNGSRR
jgi:cell division protein FtsL